MDAKTGWLLIASLAERLPRRKELGVGKMLRRKWAIGMGVIIVR